MEKNGIPDPIIIMGYIGFIMLIVFFTFKALTSFQDIIFMKADIKELRLHIYKLESEIRTLEYKEK